MKKLIFCFVIFLAGCAAQQPKVFTHATKNEADFKLDQYECKKDAFAEINSMGYAVNPFMAGQISDTMNECLIAHGWVETEQSFGTLKPNQPYIGNNPYIGN